MKQKTLLFIVALMSLTHLTYSQAQYQRSAVLEADSLLLPQQDLQWFRDAKFGLFIHWGLYSIPGKGEWSMFYYRNDIDEYKKLANEFSAKKYDPKKWMEIAKNAGCKYVVLTTRHHDGFCLFDTKFGDYDAVNSAAKRDLIAEYVDAARSAQMKIGFYYSPPDWRYPGYFFPNMYRSSAEKMKEQTYVQVKELLTNYGEVDILWWDGGSDEWLGAGGLEYSWEKAWHKRENDTPYTGDFSWEPLKLAKMARKLQPKMLINERGGWKGDFDIHEERFLTGKMDRLWEYCDNLALNGWGWRPIDKETLLSLEEILRYLVKIVSLDGNFLLNVGPDPQGEIEPELVERLEEIGEFMSKYGESIYGTRGGIYDETWGGTTLTDDAIYVHVLDIPSDGVIKLPATGEKIKTARYMNGNEKVSFIQNTHDITLKGVANKHNDIDVIIKIQLTPR
ncbi:alpha-L-fucosidase [Sabulilitoribacter arenilitoris]|uniref:alpha-L-fucosidase n=1 Tax=Wocania arenilitoris TaxID=2044858 RepID=A0AAE3EQL2_9FLAO|nr:alpha-L-fucosidase [Wocania arenilitoris]MCF7568802.1 alpha-L-fucosidase [Wocania arenilitoris]